MFVNIGYSLYCEDTAVKYIIPICLVLACLLAMLSNVPLFSEFIKDLLWFGVCASGTVGFSVFFFGLDIKSRK